MLSAETDRGNRQNPLKIIDLVASIEVNNGDDGRECYAFTWRENLAFELIKAEVRKLFEKLNIPRESYEITVDAIGNLFITWFGRDRSKTVMSGSHVDSVLMGGKYDGVAGVNSAFNFLQLLAERRVVPQCNYTFALFRGEESSPTTGTTCLGSRIATGTITQEEAEKIEYKAPGKPPIFLKDHLERTYGVGTWEKILEEIRNPPLRHENIARFVELHIEQSAVIEKNDLDVGIVIGGIGSAIREEIFLEIAKEEMIVEPNAPYVEFSLSFFGEEAHTGGTPPNPKEKWLNWEKDPTTGDLLQVETMPWYRKDAIVAASKFLQLLLKIEGDDLKVLDFQPTNFGGYTTVPKEQFVRLAVPKGKYENWHETINDSKYQVYAETGVRVESQCYFVRPGMMTFFCRERLQELLEIPLLVENAVRKMVEAQGDYGSVRATVTDMALTADLQNHPGILTAKLDLRDVDPEAMKQLQDEIEARIRTMKDPSSEMPPIRRVSSKPFAKIDDGGVKVLKILADRLGLSAAMMPSLPGHDGSSLARIGVPVSMIFIRHPGHSHTKVETMEEEDYCRAERLYQEYLTQELGFEQVA